MTEPGDAQQARAAADPRPNMMHAGLLGRGIQRSRTPYMHEAEGARLGLNYVYHLFDFDRLELADDSLSAVVRRARDEGYVGLNVTHPFKERVIATLDNLAPEAKAIGAVNTITFHSGATVGHNTDCWGFAESFRRGLRNVAHAKVVLLGSGGAGMAVANALLELGIEDLAIVDAEPSKAAQLADRLGAPARARSVLIDSLHATLAQADGLVNATPVGMARYPGMPIECNWLRPDLWVADIVYLPSDTELLRSARAVGCQTLDGTGMAIFQAVKAFQLITRVAPDPNHMARHFEAS